MTEAIHSSALRRRTVPLMGTLVTIDVPGPLAKKGREESSWQNSECQRAVERAFEWFRRIETCCTRFDPGSELMRLSRQIGVAVPVSAMLYEAVQFALAVAEASGGAFDPTVGQAMEARGFDRDYRSGRAIHGPLSPSGPATYRPTYHDVRLDPARRSITLLRPLILDLGAVAKGLAIDMAARELRPFQDFAVDAGGDLYLGGSNPHGAPWSVGIRHPRSLDDLIDLVRVSDRAVCTSGDYERRCPGEIKSEPRRAKDAKSEPRRTEQIEAQHIPDHHILDPRTGASASAAVSATVIAPSAMLADALATAAFVLGPAEGIALLDRLGADGLIVAPSLEVWATTGLARKTSAATGSAPEAQVMPGIFP